MRHVLRTIAWRSCIEPEGFRPGLLDLFGLRMVGEALNVVTPAGPMLGESVKIWAASKHIPGRSSASSVVIENIIYGLGAALFMMSGVVLTLVEVATSLRSRLLGWALLLFLATSLVVPFGIFRRGTMALGAILDRLRAVGWTCHFLDQYGPRIRSLERDIHGFFRTRPEAFAYILAIEIVTNFTGVAEAYLILRVITTHVSLTAACLVEITNRAVQLIFAFVPFGVGIDEGGTAATLQALGYTASDGVSLAVLRKVRTVFWAALGLLLATKYSNVPRPLKGEA